MKLWQHIKAGALGLASGVASRIERVLVYRDHPDAMAFDAGKMSRLDADFAPALLGPNATAEQYLDLARRRSTALIESNPLISGAVETLINNVVGPEGIWLQPDTGDEALDKQIAALWWEFAEGVDPSRRMTIAESQREAVAEYARVGEWLCHYPTIDAFNGFAAGPSIEMIDTDRMPLTEWWSFGGKLGGGVGGRAANVPAGHTVRQGVELNGNGQVVAYHVLKDHPSDGGVWTAAPRETVRIDAAAARLAVRRGKYRPGRHRGVPWTAPIVTTVRLEDSFHEAGITQAKLAASFGVFAQEASSTPGTTTPNSPFTDASGQALKTVRPGVLGWFRGKGEIKTVGTSLPGPNFQQACALQQKRVAAGLNMSYSVISRDYQGTTFSSCRAEGLEDRKGWTSLQIDVLVQHTRPFYNAIINWGLLTGRITITPAQQAKLDAAGTRSLYNATAIKPGWDWVNPQQESNADKTALESGTTDPYTVCGKQGQHAEDVVRRRLKIELFEINERKRLNLPPKAAVQPSTGQDTPPVDDDTDDTVDPPKQPDTGEDQ